MSTAIQRRRGTTAQHAAFTGLTGETTVDTDKNVVVVHNGATAGGFPLLRENGSQNLVTTGTVTGASLSPTSSTVPTNGIYLPAANSVAISTGGSGRLFVDASGRVGVGTFNPLASLHVISPATTSWFTFRGTTSGFDFGSFLNSAGHVLGFLGAGNSAISTALATDFAFRAETNLVFASNGNSEKARIDSSGRLLIGTSSSPTSDLKLAVNGPVGASDYLCHIFNKSLQVKFFNTGNSGQFLGLAAEDSATFVNGDTFKIFRQGSAVERVRIDSSGRFGIGTTSPSQLLTVQTSGTSTTAGGNVAARIESNGSGRDVTLQFSDNVANSSTISMVGSQTVFAQAGSESVRIDASRRLLVGTSSSSGAPSSGSVIQLNNQASVRAVDGGGITNQRASTASATTLNCVIDVPMSSNIFSSFIGSLYICQQLTNSEKSFLAEYRVKIYNAGSVAVFTLVDSVDDSSPNNVTLTFSYSYSNRQITVTSNWTTATSSAITCSLVGAGVAV